MAPGIDVQPEKSMGRRKESTRGAETDRPDDEGEAGRAANTRITTITRGSWWN
jgi:hypothetical protein